MASATPEHGRPGAVDNARLSRAIASGDEAAFAAFYEAWFPATLSLARTASRRDESFCLDVVQDVMLTVAKKLPALRDGCAVGAWMRRTVCHAVTDRLRAEQRRQRRERELAVLPAAVPAAEPWRDLAAAEQRCWLLARLEELPEQERQLLAARFSPTITVTAAGALLGLSSDAAYGRLRRALERLRQLAAEWTS